MKRYFWLSLPFILAISIGGLVAGLATPDYQEYKVTFYSAKSENPREFICDDYIDFSKGGNVDVTLFKNRKQYAEIQGEGYVTFELVSEREDD